MQPAAINEDLLHQLAGQAIVDFGASLNAPLIVIGDALGLYRALSDGPPMTSTELASRTGTAERYVREWLRAQAAGGYVTYDPDADRYSLSAEQAMLLADEDSPVFFIGAFQSALAATRIGPRLKKAFRTGEGIGWHQHDHDLFHGTERFFRPGYRTHLTGDWIASLDGVTERLSRGGRVADVGCGFGASTLIMAEAFPHASFVGIDVHEPSVDMARRRAADAGLSDHVRFETGSARSFDGGPYDFITTFDALHDMGDPVGAARHIRSSLTADGTWMIVEPFANDSVEDNLNPIGRALYAVSTLVCTPASLDQDVGLALGAQAGEARLREVVTAGGFTRFRRAAETPFNLVFEARP